MSAEDSPAGSPRVRSVSLVLLGAAFWATGLMAFSYCQATMFRDSVFPIDLGDQHFDLDRTEATRLFGGVTLVGAVLFFVGKGKAKI